MAHKYYFIQVFTTLEINNKHNKLKTRYLLRKCPKTNNFKVLGSQIKECKLGNNQLNISYIKHHFILLGSLLTKE